MAELVDALGSGPSGGNTVEVRVLFWAPVLKNPHLQSNGYINQAPSKLMAIHLSEPFYYETGLTPLAQLSWHLLLRLVSNGRTMYSFGTKNYLQAIFGNIHILSVETNNFNLNAENMNYVVSG
jgi:hypothetical protein